MYCEDIQSDERCTLEECRMAGFSSFAALTLKSGAEILGALGFASLRSRDFSKEGPFLEALANGLAVGLKKSLLFEQLQRRAEEVQESLNLIKQGEAERQQLEHQLRQSQKMEAIGTLAGGIAHDFNNILTPIIGFTEMSLSRIPPDSKINRNMNEVLTAANRAQELVKQILTFSRQTEHEKRPLFIEPVVKEVMKLLRSTLPSTITINQDISKNTRPILADPTSIHQVLMNLCMNAYHAMRDKGGILTVSLKELEVGLHDSDGYHDIQPGPCLKITVSDTGHGMSKEILERIFSPYFSTKPEGEGTGLGLSVVHGIIKSHKGRINVYSEPQKGTTFDVLLPVIEISEGLEDLKKAFMNSLPTGHEHILLVDDENQILLLIDEMLSNLGYKVTTRNSGIDAYESFREQPKQFDLVITDQTMPGMTGIDLAKKLLRIRTDISVILCTGYSETISEKTAKLIGIQEYLMKPVAIDKLAKTVRNVLNRTTGAVR
jgi:signal transduction histidine kinase/ActR/RegA family two-component response regulator